MAGTSIDFNSATQHGAELKSVIDRLRSTREDLDHVIGVMATMHDGSDYSHLETKFGITTGQGEGAWNELLSFQSKINGDGSVSNVNAAWKQLERKFG
jgi:hypothetical protein